jgi:ATP dependent DNA ligase domain
VLHGVDGISDFNGLHSRKHDDEVQFYAFDILAEGGEDLRKLPLSMRKTNLARLLARRVDGIFLSDFEQGEIGPDLFRHACLMGLEGLVSKHRESPYRAPVGVIAGSRYQEPDTSCVQPRPGSVWLSTVQSVDQGMRFGMRCRLSPTAGRAAMCPDFTLSPRRRGRAASLAFRGRALSQS